MQILTFQRDIFEDVVFEDSFADLEEPEAEQDNELVCITPQFSFNVALN